MCLWFYLLKQGALTFLDLDAIANYRLLSERLRVQSGSCCQSRCLRAGHGGSACAVRRRLPNIFTATPEKALP